MIREMRGYIVGDNTEKVYQTKQEAQREANLQYATKLIIAESAGYNMDEIPEDCARAIAEMLADAWEVNLEFN